MSAEFPVFWMPEGGNAQRSGYIDAKGKLVREFPYTAITAPTFGLAFYTTGRRWSKGRFWGLMRADGTPLTSDRFTSIKPFAECLAVAAENEDEAMTFSFGFLNANGEWQIAPQFRSACSMSEGAAYVKQGEESALFSLIDTTGRVIIENVSLGGQYVKEGLASAYEPKTRRCGFRDVSGEWRIPAAYTNAHDFSEGVAAVWDGKPGKEIVRFIFPDGKTAIEPAHYRSVEGGFSEGLACVYRRIPKTGQDFAGFIDRNGDETIACRWALAKPFSEGLAAVLDPVTDLWGYIDREGALRIKCQFGAAEPFHHGLARTRATLRIAPDDYINSAGDVVWRAGQKPGDRLKSAPTEGP